jgi:two-component system nitrate/nitrite response regulator NarL
MTGVFFVGSRLSREGLKGILAGSGFSALGEAGTLAETHPRLCTAEGQRAQILLIYPEGFLGGVEEEMLRAIHRDQPTVKLVILGDAGSLGLLSRTCPTEIDGYLLKDMSASSLTHSLHLIISGQRILPPVATVTARPDHDARPSQEPPIGAMSIARLSGREDQVLRFLVGGSSNKTIARELAISHETVKVHMKSLLRKLNARNRTQAALWAIGNRGKPGNPPPWEDDRKTLVQDESLDEPQRAANERRSAEGRS